MPIRAKELSVISGMYKKKKRGRGKEKRISLCFDVTRSEVRVIELKKERGRVGDSPVSRNPCRDREERKEGEIGHKE